MTGLEKLADRLVVVDAEIGEAQLQLEAALIAGGETKFIRDYLQAAHRERAATVLAIEAARAEAAAVAQAAIDAAAAEIVNAVVERARAESAMLIVPAFP